MVVQMDQDGPDVFFRVGAVVFSRNCIFQKMWWLHGCKFSVRAGGGGLNFWDCKPLVQKQIK